MEALLVMRVSVILPVHNKEAWLEESVRSVLDQTYRDIEVIAVDDKSTDGSLRLLRGIGDDRLRVIALENNLGPAGAAQRAIDLARGEYVVRMDADDIMLPDRIAEQVKFMDANPELGASGSHQQVLGSDTLMRASLTHEDCLAGALFQIPMFQPTTIYRRRILVDHDVRFQDDWPRYGEDWWYQARLLRVTRVANMDKALLLYRVGDQNVRARIDRERQLRILYEGLFAHFDCPLPPERILAHLHAVKWSNGPLRPAHVRAVRSHLDALRAFNAQRRAFPEAAFNARLDRVWNEFGFKLPPSGLRVMLAYAAYGKSMGLGKIRYMLSSWARGRP